jgi:hypothetical protein
MSKTVQIHLLRLVLVFLAQILVFKQATYTLGGIAFIHILYYPIAFLMLPIKTPKALTMLVAFVFGLGLDFFYNSPGVHAAACVFSAYVRTLVFALLEPFSGYGPEDSPTINTMGFGWFVSYISVVLLVHIFTYFSIEAFSFVYFFRIFINSLFSFFASFVAIIISQFLFRFKH